jgi:hypothetical protein
MQKQIGNARTQAVRGAAGRCGKTLRSEAKKGNQPSAIQYVPASSDTPSGENLTGARAAVLSLGTRRQEQGDVMAAEASQSTEDRSPAPGWGQWVLFIAAALALLAASEALWLWQTWPVRELLHPASPITTPPSAR